MNVKKGDMAYIVGGVCVPSRNLGRVVEVEDFVGCHPLVGPAWNVRSSSLLNTNQGKSMDCVCADAWLRPISGILVDDNVTREVTA